MHDFFHTLQRNELSVVPATLWMISVFMIFILFVNQSKALILVEQNVTDYNVEKLQ